MPRIAPGAPLCRNDRNMSPIALPKPGRIWAKASRTGYGGFQPGLQPGKHLGDEVAERLHQRNTRRSRVHRNADFSPGPHPVESGRNIVEPHRNWFQ